MENYGKHNKGEMLNSRKTKDVQREVRKNGSRREDRSEGRKQEGGHI